MLRGWLKSDYSQVDMFICLQSQIRILKKAFKTFISQVNLGKELISLEILEGQGTFLKIIIIMLYWDVTS